MPESDGPMSAVEYVRLQDAYGGMYVARQGAEVVAGGRTAGEMLTELERKGMPVEEVVLSFVRAKGVFYAL